MCAKERSFEIEKYQNNINQICDEFIDGLTKYTSENHPGIPELLEHKNNNNKVFEKSSSVMVKPKDIYDID